MKELFQKVLEFIDKYQIDAYAVNVYPNNHIHGSRIRIQGSIESNEFAIKSLEPAYDIESKWYTCIHDGIDLTLTT